jgi:hypothetical protein
MNKVLAYCAFLHREEISLPESGVGGAPVQGLAKGALRLLWSRLEWPFADSLLQRNAVEFHQVISHVFSQGAVIPFRLLSLFDDPPSLAAFLDAQHSGFVADLERLRDLVQMECVLYLAPQPGTRASGRDYLEGKADLLRAAESFESSILKALGSLSLGTRKRESKSGTRIFVLVERGNEERFRCCVGEVPVPERLARRTSGPWPTAEFLSDAVKVPPITGSKTAGPR